LNTKNGDDVMALQKEPNVLVLPGYLDSGPGHWQTRWEAAHASFSRVRMPDWEQPVRDDWCRTLDAAVTAAASDGAPVVFAAHSLGCLTVAWWASRYAAPAQRDKVAGALLVAVPDPAGRAFPAAASGFAPVPDERLPFPTIVVASTDDPYGGVPFSHTCAAAWGSRWISIGARGHINADSGLGDWQDGLSWLKSFVSVAS
jgi:predicted alpha/beta hydrolase family esterase